MERTYTCFLSGGYYYLHDISFNLRRLGNILSAVNQTHGHFLLCPLDPEVGLYRGRARVSFVEKRHEGTIHSRSLRGTGARAHDDADGNQEDGHNYGTQHHGDSPDISDYFLSSGIG